MKCIKLLDIVTQNYSVSQKVVPPETFCNIFTQAKYISMRFCPFVASLYPHALTNLRRFILICNKMALIFLGALIINKEQILTVISNQM